MKRPFRLLAIAVVLATTLGMLSACDDDEDNPMDGGPTTGKVSGTVNFTGTWPTTGDVQVSIYSTLMTPPGVPGGPPDAFTEPLIPATDYPTYNYTLEGLDPGDYAAIFVGWRDPANPSGAKLLGMHWIYVDSLGIAVSGLPKAPGPTTISVDAGDNITNLDIEADLGLIP